MNQNLLEIQKIVQALEITPQRRILVYGRPADGDFSNPYIQQPSNKMLFQSLQNLIYTIFYCKNPQWQQYINSNTVSNMPGHGEVERFMTELSQQNVSTERFDPGWSIEQIEAQGTIVAKKGNYTRSVFPGEFLNEGSFSQPPVANGQIRLLVRKEYKDPAAGFYYAFGSTVAEDNQDQLVRVYFNITPAGVKQLVKSLTELLNSYSVPFNFKCVNHPFFYTRCDVAVLYFEKRYSDIVFLLLPELYKAVEQHLLPDLPLFTKPLAKGIAFAENPLKADESFGTHISKMITQGVMNAINKNAPKQYWVQEIKTNIEQRHKYSDIESLYVNPNSKYPYAFPKFN